MKKKIKKNLLVAGGIVAGIGTIAAEIAMDNYLKKNLPQPKSFGGNSARTFADLGVVFTGYSIAGGHKIIIL